MKSQLLYQNDNLKWHFIGRDLTKDNRIIDTNQFLIQADKHAILTDPGGAEIFPQVITAVSNLIDVEQIKYIFCSHQDPDIISSLPLWLSLCPNVKILLSGLWAGLISHYGARIERQTQFIPDHGGFISLGGHDFELVQAHFLHSPGNFSFYDKSARILFSGDIGGGFFQPDYPLFVENFNAHKERINLFHKRLMPSNEAKKRWIHKVRKLNPQMICPQHGALFAGEVAQQFIDWFDDLEVGITNE